MGDSKKKEKAFYGRLHLELLLLERVPFSLQAEFRCDYVIHQGITIKGEGEGVEEMEGNSGAADGHRLATARGQECFVPRCVRQVARRR